MSGIIGRKVGMTSIFSADGQNVACTLIEAGPCVVTQVKNLESDGYNAVQLGYGERKEKHTSKPLMGHFKKAGTTPATTSASGLSFHPGKCVPAIPPTPMTPTRRPTMRA